MKKLLALLLLTSSVAAQAQPVKEELKSLEQKIVNMKGDIADLKKNTAGLGDVIKLIQENYQKLDADMLTALSDAFDEAKKEIKSEQAEYKRFAGPDNKCGPGSECFRFKKELGSFFADFQYLLMETSALDSKALPAGEFDDVFKAIPDKALYPVYLGLNPSVSVLSTRFSNTRTALQELKTVIAETESCDVINKRAKLVKASNISISAAAASFKLIGKKLIARPKKEMTIGVHGYVLLKLSAARVIKIGHSLEALSDNLSRLHLSAKKTINHCELMDYLQRILTAVESKN